MDYRELWVDNFALTHHPGICCWCRCTLDAPCVRGCKWADGTRTICTSCVALNTAMHTISGRRALAHFLHDQQWRANLRRRPS